MYLDRTAFYPTSGGQPNDLGSLGGKRVLDVIDEGERVAHLVDGPVEAEKVQGSIDWARRFDNMQQHTGQHLLSAVLADAFGYQTVSVHFGSDTSSLDLDVGTMSPEQVREAEVRANAVVFENRPVTIAFEEAGAASGLRKASDRSGTLRVITIADLDRSACGVPTSGRPARSGASLLRGVERVKKQVRLEFLCGELGGAPGSNRLRDPVPDGGIGFRRNRRPARTIREAASGPAAAGHIPDAGSRKS